MLALWFILLFHTSSFCHDLLPAQLLQSLFIMALLRQWVFDVGFPQSQIPSRRTRSVSNKTIAESESLEQTQELDVIPKLKRHICGKGGCKLLWKKSMLYSKRFQSFRRAYARQHACLKVFHYPRTVIDFLILLLPYFCYLLKSFIFSLQWHRYFMAAYLCCWHYSPHCYHTERNNVIYMHQTKR